MEEHLLVGHCCLYLSQTGDNWSYDDLPGHQRHVCLFWEATVLHTMPLS